MIYKISQIWVEYLWERTLN